MGKPWFWPVLRLYNHSHSWKACRIMLVQRFTEPGEESPASVQAQMLTHHNTSQNEKLTNTMVLHLNWLVVPTPQKLLYFKWSPPWYFRQLFRFWHSIRQPFLHSVWHSIWHSVWHNLTYFLEFYLASFQAFILAFYLASILTFFLIFFPAFFPAYVLTWHSIWFWHILAFYLTSVQVQACQSASGAPDRVRVQACPSWRSGVQVQARPTGSKGRRKEWRSEWVRAWRSCTFVKI